MKYKAQIIDISILSKLYDRHYNIIVGQIGYYEPDDGRDKINSKSGVFYFSKPIQHLPFNGDNDPAKWNFGGGVLKMKFLE